MSAFALTSLFYIDSLSIMMMVLVGFICLTVGSFSTRYMKGDTHYIRFFSLLVLLTLSLMIMVSADHMLLLLLIWGLNNVLLVMLIIHKPHWKAAYQSGIVAAKNFALGFVFLTLAFFLLYKETGLGSIQAILHENITSTTYFWVQCFLIIGAMTQSAIFPFHRWLLSSLNSPTPVSAFMHAGLINGGGFLLIRFAPLYESSVLLLTVIFTAGLFTAIVGTLWKLMQFDIKRMLACSTMAQMGFMMVQCGLGLYPAAVAHLLWHSLFKAYLFLSSAAVAQEKRVDLGYPPRFSSLLLAISCGLAGSIGFALMSGKSLLALDTTFVLIAVAFVAGSMTALQMLKEKQWKRFPMAFMATGILGGLYGFSVYGVSYLLGPAVISNPQPLNLIHMTAIAMMIAVWLGHLFYKIPVQSRCTPTWLLGLYVKMLNASQPHSKTITAHRNHYRFN